MEKLIAAAGGLAAGGGESLVFAVKGGKLDAASHTLAKAYPAHFRLYPFTTREGLDTLTARHFEQFDFFVAPPHERSNWALGLGLPLCMVDPPIGTFAPLNRQLLLDRGVATALPSRAEAETFGRTCSNRAVRDALVRMAEQGWDHEGITGFTCIAEYLQQTHPETA
ncbi:MAG: hypothetical protein EOM10_15465 [Opitutae bacterium]|nr:hypothetical protein [Opitutae bacterium]